MKFRRYACSLLIACIVSGCISDNKDGYQNPGRFYFLNKNQLEYEKQKALKGDKKASAKVHLYYAIYKQDQKEANKWFIEEK